MYSKVDVFPGDEADVAKDPAGYTGQFTRKNSKHRLKPMNDREFLGVIARDNQLMKVMNMIRYIDKEKNGCVTTSEMDDILKEVYPVEFKGRDYMAILKHFCQIQNPILLDYNKFKDFLQVQIKEINSECDYTSTRYEAKSVAGSKSQQDSKLAQ